MTAIRGGSRALSDDGVRAFLFFIAFFVISGFRAVFQFPSELSSNWLFRLTEDHWAETARSATRKRVPAGGLAPALFFVVAIHLADFELAAEQRGSYGLLYLAVGAVPPVLAWRRHPRWCASTPRSR